jgi:heme oxygenase (biliverdin-producing, ferredoxin)
MIKEGDESRGMSRTMSDGASSPSACPYAVALHWNSDDDTVTSNTTIDDHESINSHSKFGISHTNETKRLIQACPAFQNGHCPFASCTNEHEIRKMLLQIPTSHYNQNNDNEKIVDAVTTTNLSPISNDRQDDIATPFLKVLQELHSVVGMVAATSNDTASTTDDSKLPFPILPNKCPVLSSSNQVPMTSTANTATNATKFTHVIMDGYSLAEIMARLAKEVDEEEDGEGADISEGHDAAASVEDQNNKVTSMVENTRGIVPVKLVDDATTTRSQEQQQRKLSVTIKSGTAASHVAAENVHFVRNFIRGQIDPLLFAELTCKLFYVYQTLEYYILNDNAVKNNIHLQQFHSFHQQLQRTESLKDDLDYWFGTNKADQIIQSISNDRTTTGLGSGNGTNTFVSLATKDYLDRIQYCAQNNPLLLLAHSYTRYLGDLSGGKILARVARKALQLSNQDDGLAFYDFTATIQNAKQFKDEYRLALDNLYPPLSEYDIQLLVAEANIAFCLNMRLFEELDVLANVPDAKVRPLIEAIQPYAISDQSTTNIGNTNNKNHQFTGDKEIPKECPFAKLGQMNNDVDGAPVTAATTANTKRCPWPFIIFHNPIQALHDWQTWMIFGLVLCWLYHQFLVQTAINGAVDVK